MKKLGPYELPLGMLFEGELDMPTKAVPTVQLISGRTVVQDVIILPKSGVVTLNSEYGGKKYCDVTLDFLLSLKELAKSTSYYDFIYMDDTYRVQVLSVTGSAISHNHLNSGSTKHSLQIELLIV